MSRPPKALKTFCNRVASAALTDDGTSAVRMARLAGLMGTNDVVEGPGRQSNTTSSGQVSHDLVGIWEKKTDNGQIYFSRRVDMIRDWNLWANVGRIEPKGTKLRVVLVGESVARGYLYDPQFTPAMVLESILQGHLGKGKVDVVDLARTNLGFNVGELAKSALLLEPDAVIIFSGNNWRPNPGSPASIDTVLREQGMSGLKRLAEERIAVEIKTVVNDVASYYERHNVPLIWIIPEFNLDDWRDPVANAPHLHIGANEEWIRLWPEADRALQRGDLQTAADAAKRMVELDGGVTSAGLYILADCSQKSGDLEATRHYLELAKDSRIWELTRLVSPRIFTVTAETLREEIGRYDDQIVDMPKILRDYLEGGVPGRRLFLDYCHHTTEGIQVAMAAAASCVLRSLGESKVLWRSLVDTSIAPSREAEAEAAFLAAVHNAHWWQSYDLVHHYCSQSVGAAPGIADVMTRFIDMQTLRTPMLMSETAQELVELGSPSIQHYLLRYNNGQLDPLLLAAVVASLSEVGIDRKERLTNLRRTEHSVARTDIDLLDYYYLSAARQPEELKWALPVVGGTTRNKENIYYKAYGLESKFIFVGEAISPVELCLTCRLPEQALEEGSIRLDVNGQRIGEMVINREWGSWEVLIPGEVILDDLNEITIHWPMPPDFPGEVALETAFNDLVDQIFPEFMCIFGEVHSFTATDASRRQTVTPEVRAQ